jgi:predicted NodU family carbamoyl transferase
MILDRAGASGKTQRDPFRNPLGWQRGSANRRARGLLWFDEFGAVTGVPVIMNTAFNLRGEAIVNTPTNALRVFFSSGMDPVVMGSFLVEK